MQFSAQKHIQLLQTIHQRFCTGKRKSVFSERNVNHVSAGNTVQSIKFLLFIEFLFKAILQGTTKNMSFFKENKNEFHKAPRINVLKNMFFHKISCFLLKQFCFRKYFFNKNKKIYFAFVTVGSTWKINTQITPRCLVLAHKTVF